MPWCRDQLLVDDAPEEDVDVDELELELEDVALLSDFEVLESEELVALELDELGAELEEARESVR